MFSIHVCNMIFHLVNVQFRSSTIVVVSVEYSVLMRPNIYINNINFVNLNW